MTDALRDLPRHGDEALGPCFCCGKLMLEAAVPIFYRVTVEHCGIEAKAVRERVGLAQMLGGGIGGLALAAVMGPGTKPVVVMSSKTSNICLTCSQSRATVVQLIALSDEGDAA